MSISAIEMPDDPAPIEAAPQVAPSEASKPETPKPARESSGPKYADAIAEVSRRVSALEGKDAPAAGAPKSRTSVVLIVAVVAAVVVAVALGVVRWIVNRRRGGTA